MAYSTFYIQASGKKSGLSQENAIFPLRAKLPGYLGIRIFQEGYSFDRLNLRFTLYYHPVFLEDIGLFVQFYHGSDYYNLYFGNRLDVIRFGIMTEKLRF
ncbi:MAG: hypothetical protein IPF68_12345 [Bacteroidales bacterium]|nr:hypothetical protein [Bacteroidales bacterium]